jgi:TonB family protein
MNGQVVLEATGTADGHLIKLKVRKSLDSSLDEAGVNAARTGKLKPATDTDGSVVPVRQAIEISFDLH